MSVKASLVGWPKGVPKESVAEPIRLTIEAPGAMFDREDDEEMAEVLVGFGRALSKLVKQRTGIELQWGMEGRK